MKFLSKYAHIFFLVFSSVAVAIIVTKMNDKDNIQKEAEIDLTFSKSESIQSSVDVSKESSTVEQTASEKETNQVVAQVTELEEEKTNKNLDLASAVSLFLESVEKNKDSFSAGELKDIEELAVNMQYEIDAVANKN